MLLRNVAGGFGCGGGIGGVVVVVGVAYHVAKVAYNVVDALRPVAVAAAVVVVVAMYCLLW